MPQPRLDEGDHHARRVVAHADELDSVRCRLLGSVISIVPLIVAFLLLRRFWPTGLSGGAVMG